MVDAQYVEADIEKIQQPYRQQLIDSGNQDVFIWGDVGVGKTYAMAALAKHYLCDGYECKWLNFDTFCSRVRSTWNNNSRITEYELIEQIAAVDKIFIDDIGLRSKQETDFAYVTFYSIINKRQGRKLQTIISTNKNIDQLAGAFDYRIASRLSTAINIHIDGSDRRLTNDI